MTNSHRARVYREQFGAFLRAARARAALGAADVAARVGLSTTDLRSFEQGAAACLSRSTLLALAAIYELAPADMLAAAGAGPCLIPEVDDFVGGGCPSYCACSWLLADHSAVDLARALWQATRTAWHPRAWPTADEGARQLAVYRAGMVELADDPEDAQIEVHRRQAAERARNPSIPASRPLIDLLLVMP